MLLQSLSAILASLVRPTKQVNPAFNSTEFLKHEHNNISPNVLPYDTFFDLRDHYHYLWNRGGTQQVPPKNLYEGHLESKERFAIKKYLLIIGKKKNMQVLSHTFTYFST
jgi:hypothetical protein